MSATVFIAFLALVLFGLSYMMRRRFGVLALALAAGSLLSVYGAPVVTDVLGSFGVSVVQPQAALVLTLLPALLLLISGPVYHNSLLRIGGSLLFALLAITFAARSLGALFVLDPMTMGVFLWLESNQGIVITTALVLAIIDVWLGQSSKGHRSSRSSH